MYGQLYFLLVSVKLFLSFLVVSMTYENKGKEILLRKGQGASRSHSSFFSGDWIAGEGETRCSPGVP